MKGGSDPSQNIQIMKWGSDLSESFVSEGRRSPLVVLGSTTISFRSVASKGFPSGYSKSACVRVSACSACPQKTPTLRGGFRKRRLTNTPRRHRLADGQLSPLYAPLPRFSSSGAASVMMCCSACPASSSAPSVLPEDRSGHKCNAY